MTYTLKTVYIVDTPRWQTLSFQRFDNGRPLRVVKRDDAKIEVISMIPSGDPNDHVHLLYVLSPQYQPLGSPSTGWYTHFVTVSLIRFFSFRNVDKCHARMVHDLVARPQLSDIDPFRDELSQGNGEAVCRNIMGIRERSIKTECIDHIER